MQGHRSFKPFRNPPDQWPIRNKDLLEFCAAVAAGVKDPSEHQTYANRRVGIGAIEMLAVSTSDQEWNIYPSFHLTPHLKISTSAE
jgi:hypothetical protein